jgi:hypothetical protein
MPKNGRNVSSAKRDELQLTALKRFFNNSNNFHQIYQVVEGPSPISLRMIDWFVTNYCRVNHTIVSWRVGDVNHYCSVHDDYREQLKAHTKKRFDPFKRTERLIISYGTVKMETTIAQLNFFKWLLEKHILAFIATYYDAIQKEMMLFVEQQKADVAKAAHKKKDDAKTVSTKRGRKTKANNANMLLIPGHHTILFD